ncbi:MAG TPA: hypothetical protein VNG53_04750, partial [Bacteroidia bacterium]|nr:hypothetical protein [Bacteroidia bacterium]
MDEELIGKIKKLGYVGRQTGFKDEEHYEKGIFTYKYWAIPEENDKLINTPFYYDKEKDFIHFTSIDSLFEILNSRHLRLYNLLNMDDKFELDYAQRELSFKVLEKENVGKEQLYSFSMCSSSEILNEEPKKKKHLLWKLHGKDGNGVVIRLKIENDLSTWRCYYLTKCFYDLKNFEAIKELNKKTDNEFLDQLVLA